MARFIDWPGDPVHWQVQEDLCTKDGGQLRCPLFGPEGLRLAEWLASGQARVVKQGLHRTVYHVVLPGLDFHLKHYPLADTRAWLRQLVRPSKARMEYDCALAVAARGVPTFRPLALGEQRALLGTGTSYLITRSLDDITVRLPGVVAVAAALESTDIVLDGEAIALDTGGRPRPFQETSSAAATHADDG